MPDPLDLDALTARNTARRELKAGASKGPWKPETGAHQCFDEPWDLWYARGPLMKVEGFEAGKKAASADARFIAAARSDPVEDDVDRLVAEVRRLRANLEYRRGI